MNIFKIKQLTKHYITKRRLTIKSIILVHDIKHNIFRIERDENDSRR